MQIFTLYWPLSNFQQTSNDCYYTGHFFPTTIQFKVYNAAKCPKCIRTQKKIYPSLPSTSYWSISRKYLRKENVFQTSTYAILQQKERNWHDQGELIHSVKLR